MLLKEVIIENFLSIEKAAITFPSSGLILLSGWNETLNRSNGAGKSAIMQAISWCLYNEFPRDIKVEELIRRGQSTCSVTVKAVFGSDEWAITRKRPADLQVSINNKKIKGSPKLLQASIEQEIGFSYKQFLVTSYFPQKGDSSRFLNQKDASAKEFLGVILNFSKAEQGYKKMHLALKDKESELSSAISKFNALHSSLERFKSISQVSLPLLPSKDEVVKIKNELDIIKVSTLNPPNTLEIDAWIESLKKKQKAIEQIRYQVSTLVQKIDSIKSKIEHLTLPSYMTCPSCNEHLIEMHEGNKNILVQFDNESAEEVRKSQENDLNRQIDEIQVKIDECNAVILKNPDVSTQLDEFISKKANLRSDYLVAEQKQKTLEFQLQSFRRMFEVYYQTKEQLQKIQVQIDETEKQVAESNLEVSKFEQEMMVIIAAKQVLSPTGAIAYSLDSVTEEINEEVTSYLDIFSHGTMTYRMSSGEDKAKIVHHITSENDEVSLGSLSGGEDRGLVLSVDFGLSEVLAKRCGVPLPSILMLDECFEGLDYIGKEKVLDALKEIAQSRCILVIDHSTELSSLFNGLIKVTKRGSISYVEVE